MIGLRKKLNIENWQLTDIVEQNYTLSGNVVKTIKDLILGKYDDKTNILYKLILT